MPFVNIDEMNLVAEVSTKVGGRCFSYFLFFIFIRGFFRRFGRLDRGLRRLCELSPWIAA